MRLVDYAKGRGIVLDVDLCAPPEERWREAARMVAPEVQRLASTIVQWCRSSLPKNWPPWLQLLAEAAVRGTADVAGRTVGIVASRLGHEYALEVRSIAQEADVSYPQLLLANVMYDLAETWHHLHPSACSSFSCALPSGTPVLARTLDWAVPKGLGRYTVLVVYHRKRRQYVSVGLTGFVGVLSAMQPGAWAVALNEAPSLHVPVRALRVPACVHLRAVCDASQTYGSIVRRMRKAQTTSPFFVHIVGTEPKEQTVIRSLATRFRQRRLEGSFIVQTNHFVSLDSENLNDFSHSYQHSRHRYFALKRRLGRSLPSTVHEALRKLSREPVTNARTMQSIAFCPATGEMRVKYRK